MKIFLSYGHDHNVPLVERIEGDLKAAGHSIWRDNSGIKVTSEWRRSIVDGLLDTDWVLGFLSRHSVRDPGVCLDELAIAIHEKGGAIATILLEGELIAVPPVSMSHIQWLDMHDWQDRQASDPAIFESWYCQKRDELLEALATPDTVRFAGEIADLDRRLKPVKQVADVAAHIKQFVGRAWLHDRLEKWRLGQTQSRIFWLTGSAGSGKSAFSAWLAHFGKANVIGINLCRYNMVDRRDAGRIIRTLAFQIARLLPDYRKLLLNYLNSRGLDGEQIDREGPVQLFQSLLVEPLKRSIDGGRRGHRYLVVIDGLDETIRDGRSDLADILSENASKLPSWLGLVVTSRPESPIFRQFAALRPIQIAAQSAENNDDIRTYVLEWVSKIKSDRDECNSITDQIVLASDGNFLYASMLKQSVTDGFIQLDRIGPIPRGLISLYERWFYHKFPDKNEYEHIRKVIEVIVAASHPVPELWLSKIFEWTELQTVQVLERLGSLFERTPNGIAPFHESLRDWLLNLDQSGGSYGVDATKGAKRLAPILWEEFLKSSASRPSEA